MGKETSTEPNARKRARGDKPSAQGRNYFTREQLDAEISLCWSSVYGAVLQSQVKANGKVLVIIRSEEKDIYYLCSGFAASENRFATLRRQLLDTRTIPETAAIIGVYTYKECMWSEVEAGSVRFDSGDTVMLIIGNAPAAVDRKRKRREKTVRGLLGEPGQRHRRRAIRKSN